MTMSEKIAWWYQLKNEIPFEIIEDENESDDGINLSINDDFLEVIKTEYGDNWEEEFSNYFSKLLKDAVEFYTENMEKNND